MDIEDSFRKFITTCLHDRGGVREKSMSIFTNTEGIREFRKALTHSSYDKINNYEMYEFLGDKSINNIVAYYIHDRYPLIKSEKWLTRIHANIISAKYLGKIIETKGFMNHVRYNKQLLEEEISKYSTARDSKFYEKMIGDFYEGFIGCVISLADKQRSRGVGYAIAYNITKSYLDEMNISLKHDEVFDPITRIKELYEGMRPIAWPFPEEVYEIKRDKERRVVTVTVYGWPLGNKTPEPGNRKVISKVTQSTKYEDAERKAKREATIIALKTLSSMGIMEKIPDMYVGNLG